MMTKYCILVDAGHGITTAGKRSPQFEDGRVFREWVFNRRLAKAIAKEAAAAGIDCVLLVPDDSDPTLAERARRANAYISANLGNRKVVLFSVHGNASGDGRRWMPARGWEAWTTKGQNNSDLLASALYEVVEGELPEIKVRKDWSDKDPDKEAEFTIIRRANCPAVLSENLFYDNRDDVALMMDAEIVEALAKSHVLAAKKFWRI